MKVVIYNDTNIAFRKIHFGSRLVMEALHELLEDAGYDVLGTIPLDEARQGNADKKLMACADLIVVNGEGSYHTNGRPDIAAVSKDYPAVLINTICYNNSDDLSHFRYICARESCSAEEIRRQVPCDVVPDVIFTAKYLTEVGIGKGRGTVRFGHSNAGVNVWQKKEKVVPILAAADKVDAESFHAACLAAYYRKPMRLRKAHTNKMRGLAKAMGVPYMAEGFYTADPDYVFDAQDRIYQMIKGLKNFV